MEPLLMIPGPTPVDATVRAALAEPVRSHTSGENAATLHRIAALLRPLFGTEQARIHVFGGSGTLAMEAALVNHAAPGDRVVVASHGYFGDRFAEIAQALGMDADVVRAPWGAQVDAAELRRVCRSGRPPALVTITHVDTSTGVLADVAALSEAARQPATIVVLDGVCATGGIEERIDDWGVDVALTGAQKALAVPPGLAILAVSERARERRAGLGGVAAYYADLQRWDPVVDDPVRYFSTHATGLLRGLEASLEEIDAEGLEARFDRHVRLAERLRGGMVDLGFEPLTDAGSLASTLSVLAVPPGVDEADLRLGMAQRGVIVAGCLGPLAGRGIRVGHMGSIGLPEIERTLAATAAALSGQAAVSQSS
ncbi:MAG TPA: alanine--glyoxylate aminotransferase family protein [Candidatus Dormibacteraeota bacterium]